MTSRMWETHFSWYHTSVLLLLLVPLVNSQGLSEIISESILRFSECTSFVNTCPPTRTSCASYICQQCTSVGYKAINSCCLQPDPAACLQTYVATADGGSISASSAAAQSSVSVDQYGSACLNLKSIYNSCESQTSAFSNLDDADAASCLCYSGASWVPNVFDNYAMSCATFYAEHSDVSDASFYSANDNFCSSVGNIRGAASVSASTTSSGHAATSTAPSASTGATASSGASVASSTQASATIASSSEASTHKMSLGMLSLAWVLVTGAAFRVI